MELLRSKLYTLNVQFCSSKLQLLGLDTKKVGSCFIMNGLNNLMLPHVDQSPELQQFFISLEVLTKNLISSLPPIDTTRNRNNSLVYSPSDLLCIHTLAHSARMRLHLPFIHSDETSSIQVFQSARTIVETVRSVALDANQVDYVDPILGVS